MYVIGNVDSADKNSMPELVKIFENGQRYLKKKPTNFHPNLPKVIKHAKTVLPPNLKKKSIRRTDKSPAPYRNVQNNVSFIAPTVLLVCSFFQPSQSSVSTSFPS